MVWCVIVNLLITKECAEVDLFMTNQVNVTRVYEMIAPHQSDII